MKDVLVTGGAGFIGSHVVNCLVSNGFHVVVVDNLSRGSLSNIDPNADFYQLDILDPRFSTLLKNINCDYVIHLAGQIDVRKSCADPAGDAKANIIGLLRVLDICRKHGVQGIVFASSGGAIYAEYDGIAVTETAPKGPLSPYGVSKLASEYYLSQFAHTTGIANVVLRLANVYGPRQNSSGEAGVVTVFAERMLNGSSTVIYGDGFQVRDFVYVKDVAEAVLAALKYAGRWTEPCGNGIDDCAFNIGTGRGTTVSELRDLCAKITRYRGATQFEMPRQGEIRWSCLSSDKAAEVLGWIPKTSLEAGLADTVNWRKSIRKRDER